MRLTHVQEERARQGREVELDVQNDEEDTEKAVPVAHFQELTRIGHDGRREQEPCGHSYEALAQGHIFEDGPIGEPAELLEQCAADEEGLVAVNDQLRSCIGD